MSAVNLLAGAGLALLGFTGTPERGAPVVPSDVPVAAPAQETPSAPEDGAAITGKGVLSEFERQMRELDAYLREREQAARERPSEERDSVRYPARNDGAAPFVTAEQRRRVDEVTRGVAPGEAREAALREAGVHPSQIAAGARFWVHPGGTVTTADGTLVRMPLSFRA